MWTALVFVSRIVCLVAAGYVFELPAAWAATLPLPSKSNVLAVMQKVAEYAQNTYRVDVPAYWDDGVYHIGMMAFYNVSQDADALIYTETFGQYNDWELARDGSGNRHNRLAAGQSWIEAHYASPADVDLTDTRAEIAQQTASSLADVIRRAGETAGAYFSVDSQFMGLPTFAKLGKLDENPQYFTRMYELFNHTKTTLTLYDTAEHLYYRDATYINRRSPNGKKVFWSRGNGWALGALVRILQALPATDPHRAEYITTFRDMSAALKGVQREDGFWNMNLADPTHYPGPETSGTALFVYGMAWGINNGLLSDTTYKPVVAQGWNALVTAVHSDGQVGYVQGIGKAPVPPCDDPQVNTEQEKRECTQYPRLESTADFGVGAFLLAGSEVYKLAAVPPPPPPGGTKYEVENLATTVSAGDSQQDVKAPSASGGTYNQGNFNAVNDSITYSVGLPAPGTYTVKIRFGKNADMGRWQFFTAGRNVGAPQDAYSSAFTYTEVDVGQVTYTSAGTKVFRFTVTGKNGASSGYCTAIDYVMLTKQ
jgi:rhamnogalacturonyl hydrolase YesR